jgi:hypothetical protein
VAFHYAGMRPELIQQTAILMQSIIRSFLVLNSRSLAAGSLWDAPVGTSIHLAGAGFWYSADAETLGDIHL